MKKDKSLKNKLVIVFVALAMIVILICGISSYIYSKGTVKKQVVQSIDENVAHLDMAIYEFLDGFQTSMEMFCELPAMKNLMEQQEEYDNVQKVLKSYQEAQPAVAFAYFGPNENFKSGKKVLTWPDTTEDLAKKSDWIASGRSWYVDAASAVGQIIYSMPYLDSTTNMPMITVSRAVTDSNKNVIGVMAFDLLLNDISEKVDSFKTIDKSKIWVINQAEDSPIVISSTLVEENNSLVEDQTLLAKLDRGASGSFNYKQYYVTYQTNQLTNWKVIEFVDKSVFSESMRGLAVVFVLVSIVSLTIAIILSVPVAKAIVLPIQQITKAAQEIAVGRFDVELEVHAKDETGILASAFQKTIDQLLNYQSYIDELAENLENMAKGTIQVTLTKEYTGQFEILKLQLETLAKNLKYVLGEINEAAQEVNSESEQVSATSIMLAEGATDQASSVEELNATILCITERINENSSYANEASSSVKEVEEQIDQGNHYMQEMLLAMENISSASNQISEIIHTIDDIAGQTNLLSLNASIEAARAGEAGRGFAVVASEIRNLALLSAKAVQTTSDLVQRAMLAVEQGTQIATHTANIFETIVKSSTVMTEKTQQIASASEEQADAIADVAAGIDAISEVVTNNSATAQESAAASEELAAQAQVLKELVGSFKI